MGGCGAWKDPIDDVLDDAIAIVGVGDCAFLIDAIEDVLDKTVGTVGVEGFDS